MANLASRPARITAVLMSIGLMLLSLMLINRIAFLGFAIGGWTGLYGYGLAIANARHAANLSIVYLIIVQCVGGGFPDVFSRSHRAATATGTPQSL